MIHYHGTPITPSSCSAAILLGRHALIPFADSRDLQIVMENAHSFIVDNSAYSAWKNKLTIPWSKYYRWVERIAKHPGFDWALIPDVIDGTEKENDRLLRYWPHGKFLGVPVFHLHESLERLQRLCVEYPRVALGSSGKYRTPGSVSWKMRMNELRIVACDKQFRPLVKFHALRGLNPELFQVWCPSSADSTAVAINIGMDCNWPEIYKAASKTERGKALAVRLEAFNSSPIWNEFLVKRNKSPSGWSRIITD